MKTLPVLLTLTYLAIFIDESVAQQKWSFLSHSPNGGNVTCLYKYNNLIFAGTDFDGIYVSANDGATWQSSDNGLPSETGIVSIGSVGSRLFIGVSLHDVPTGTYESDDNGNSWFIRSDLGASSSFFLSGNEFLASYWASGTIAYSLDGGQTFTNSVSRLATGTQEYPALTGNSKALFASADGIYRSLDGGNTWNLLTTGGAPASYTPISSLAATENYVYAGNGEGVYVSSDNGDTWTFSTNGFPTDMTDYVEQTCLAIQGNKVYFGTVSIFGPISRGAYVSSDNGNSWNQVAEPPPVTVNSILVEGNTIFMGTGGSGIVKSTDNGITWKSSDEGLKAQRFTAMASLHGNIVGVASDSVYVSTNGGKQWKGVIRSTSWMDRLIVNNDSILYGNGTDIFWSKDCKSWSAFPTPLPYYGMTFYKGNLITGGYNGVNVFNSSQGQWQPLLNEPGNEQTIWNVYAKDNFIYAATFDGIYYSSDAIQWYLGSGAPGDADYSFTASGDTLIADAGTTNSQNALLYSTDNGMSWTSSEPFHCYQVCSLGSNYVLACTPGYGLQLSIDNGATWVPFSVGLPDISKSWSVTVARDSLYAGSDQGVWAIPYSAVYPFISNVSPGSGVYNTLVTINGVNFGNNVSQVVVKFNDQVVEVLSLSPTQITVAVPLSLADGPAQITVSVNGHPAQAGVPFCVGATPAITLNSSVSPPTLTSSSSSNNQWFLNGQPIVGAVSPTLTTSSSGKYYVSVGGAGCSIPSDSLCVNLKPVITDKPVTGGAELISSSTLGNLWFYNGTSLQDSTNQSIKVNQLGTYTVQVSIHGCVGPLSDPVSVVITEDRPVPVSGFNFYPNPATDHLVVDLRGFDVGTSVEIRVTDVMGQTFLSTTGVGGESLVVGLSGWRAGIFVIEGVSGTKIQSGKLVKL